VFRERRSSMLCSSHPGCSSPAGAAGARGRAASPRPSSRSSRRRSANGTNRAKALRIWSAIAGRWWRVGLLLGGVLTDLASWRLDLLRQRAHRCSPRVATARFVPESRADLNHRHSIYPGGVVTGGPRSCSCSRSSNRTLMGGDHPKRIGLLAAASSPRGIPRNSSAAAPPPV